MWYQLAIICFFAAIVQGAIGFGFGLTALGVSGLLLAVREASPLLALPALAINIIAVMRLRYHIDIRQSLVILPAVIAGVPLGVVLLGKAPPTLLNGLLSALLIAAVVQRLVPKAQSHPWHPVYAGIPCGLLAGAMGGAFGTGGPPLVAYVASQNYERLRAVAMLQFLFIAGSIIRVFELFRQGLISTAEIPGGLLCAAAAVGGVLLGLKLLHHLSERVFAALLLVFLSLLAVRYLGLTVAGLFSG